MAIDPAERSVIRDLARKVAEIAGHPRQQQRRDLYYRHTRLDDVKPIVLVFPEGSWRELLPDSALVTKSPEARGYEWGFRAAVYQWEHFDHDLVTEPTFNVGYVRHFTGWGLEAKHITSTEPLGAWRFDPPIKTEEDLAKLRVPVVTNDDEATKRSFDATNDLIGDILTVQVKKYLPAWPSMIGHLASLRGLDQIMIDMIDRPQWVHKAMRFLADATEKLLLQAEAEGSLSLNNGDDYNGSGGQGYTDELPQKDFAGTVRLKDLWGMAEAQEIAQVSPAMHEEFVLQYQRRVLRHFGLNAYGCCEALHHKMEHVKKIPNLRKVSISPWADIRVSAEALGPKYLFSWKPNPADLAAINFDEGRIRRQIRETLAVCRRNRCVVEIIMKDTHTCNNDASRFDRWTRIAQECAKEA